jgi:hypothetical protein
MLGDWPASCGMMGGMLQFNSRRHDCELSGGFWGDVCNCVPSVKDVVAGALAALGGGNAARSLRGGRWFEALLMDVGRGPEAGRNATVDHTRAFEREKSLDIPENVYRGMFYWYAQELVPRGFLKRLLLVITLNNKRHRNFSAFIPTRWILKFTIYCKN